MEFNKNRLLQYQEYKDCFKVKVCLKNGKVIRKNFLGGIEITSNEKLRIGVDQSTAQTGFAVKKNNGEFLCLIDFVNDAHVNFGLYKAMLGLKIEQIFNSCEVEMCVVEKMWGGNKKSFEMLTNLADFISGFKYVMPGWRDAEVSSILPNVWRSAYLSDPKYKGQFSRDKVKIAAMQEGISRYSFLRDYGYNEAEGSHINDSFDALGILEGYEEKTFSQDKSIRRVANTIESTNHRYTYNYVIASDKDDLTAYIEKNCPNRKAVEYEYNNDFPFYENIHKATSVTNKIVFMNVIDDVAKIQLMWRYGCILRRSDNVYLVGWRDNISSKLGNY